MTRSVPTLGPLGVPGTDQRISMGDTRMLPVPFDEPWEGALGLLAAAGALLLSRLWPARVRRTPRGASPGSGS